MCAKRDIVAKIEEIKARTERSDWDNGITKLLFLSTHVKALSERTEELGYYPVACVAALEVYLRWEVRTLLDAGEPGSIQGVRIEDLAPKIDHELLVAVHGQRITIGDLIAHTIKLSDLDAVNKTMSQLLQTDFLDLVRDARDPEERRSLGANAPRVIESIGPLIQKVKRMFFLRHIICHEAHLRTGLKLNEIKELCSACYQFARASRYGIAHYLDPNAPLTLEESYQAAVGRVSILENQLQQLERTIEQSLGKSPMADAFKRMQEAWRSFVKMQAEFDASHHMNGNRGALYHQLALEDLGKKRLAEMKKYAEN